MSSSTTNHKRLTGVPAAARYAIRCQRYFLGQQPNPPGGYSYGLDLAAALEIEEAVRDNLVAAGFSVQPTWTPANAYQESRWKAAYHKRGLAA